MKHPFAKEIHIGPKVIRGGGPCFVVAEAGINHNGDLALAKKLVDMSVAAGADAVKFQTFVAEEEVTKKLQKVAYQKSREDDQESYFEMIKKLEFTEGKWRELTKYCKKRGIIFLSTPSEEVSARFLHTLGVPAFKIGSNDLVTLPMLQEIAGWGKPIILSTGMADLEEIQEALYTVSAAGNHNVILLQCTSRYPTPPEEMNVAVIETLKNAFGTLVGLSDHSEGIDAAPLAVLLGAVVVEKHITCDKNLPGPEQKIALEPLAFSAMVKAIRRVEGLDRAARAAEIARIPDAKILLGSPEKKPIALELEMRTATRKGIVARRAIKAGEVMTPDMLAYKRPYEGIPARLYQKIIGRKAATDIGKDEFITTQHLS